MLLKRQQKILDEYVLTIPSDHTHVFYDELPPTVQVSLENVKQSETLWCDAERYISDKLLRRSAERRIW